MRQTALKCVTFSKVREKTASPSSSSGVVMYILLISVVMAPQLYPNTRMQYSLPDSRLATVPAQSPKWRYLVTSSRELNISLRAASSFPAISSDGTTRLAHWSLLLVLTEYFTLSQFTSVTSVCNTLSEGGIVPVLNSFSTTSETTFA